MTLAYNGPNWAEILHGQDVIIDGVVSSYETVLIWSPQEHAAVGIAEIVEDVIPAGKIATGSTLVDDAGQPRRQWVLADAPPPPVPASISDRQFAQQLAILGTITEAEAIAWAARGELPAALETAVEALPVEEQFPARMLLSSATTYESAHPLVPMLGAVMSYDSSEIDDLWRAAAHL